MSDSENTEVLRYEREKDASRQKDMANRRKESGWKGYRLHLSKADYVKIQKLGKKLKYDLPDTKASLIDISAIVSYSLTVACKHEGLIERDIPKASQDRLYRQRVKEAIKHRLKEEVEKPEKLELVAKFMRNAGYSLPVVSNKTKMKIPKEQQNFWCVAWIKALVPTRR